jgi:hypothetical protein
MLSDRDITTLAIAFNELTFAPMPEAERDRQRSKLAAILAQHVTPDRVDEFYERFRARSRALLVASKRKGGKA